MSMYEIQGGRPLGGRLRVQGAKNSVLPLLAAALLAPGQSVIHNCPDLSDVSATLDILALLGCRVAREGETVTVDAAALSGSSLNSGLGEFHLVGKFAAGRSHSAHGHAGLLGLDGGDGTAGDAVHQTQQGSGDQSDHSQRTGDLQNKLGRDLHFAAASFFSFLGAP